MVVPVIASLAAAGSAITAAGGFMAAMGSLGGFLSIAGAALTTIGAVTGKKDLMKVGGLLSLGSGLVGMASSATTTAASEVAAEVAAEGGADAATSAAWADGAAGKGADTLAAAGGDGGSAAAASNAGIDQAISEAAQAGTSASEVIDPLERANQLAGTEFSNTTADGKSIYQRLIDAQSSPTSTSASVATDAAGGSTTDNLFTTKAGASDRLAEGARSMTSDQVKNLADRGARRVAGIDAFRNSELLQNIDISSEALAPSGVTINGQVVSTEPSFMERARGLASDASDWIKENKEVAMLGGHLASGAMKGMAQGRQLDFERSIYARRMANLNRPIALEFRRG